MRWRRMLFFPPLLLGLGVFFLLRQLGADAQEAAPAPQPLAVRVMTLESAAFAPSASGFGRVQAERDWQAISQVEGRVLRLALDLDIGKVLTEGALAVEIDPRDYEIALAKAEANVDSAKASLDELDVEERNTTNLLEIEQRIEAVRTADLERQLALEGRGAAAEAASDAARRDLLSQQKVVRDLENQLALTPVRRVSAQATLDTREVEFETAERDLANTKITAPFRGRVAEADVAEGQYVRVGDSLLRLEDLATAEVVAEFQPQALRNLILIQRIERLEQLLVERSGAEAGARLTKLGFTAEVEGRLTAERFIWPAEIVRLTGQIDDATGAIGVVARIQQPLRPNLQTRRPPLSVGAFVELRLIAPSREMMLAPRSAIRRDEQAQPFVYVVDEASTLQRAAVELGPVFGDSVMIESGPAPGAVLVLSDPAPAIIGMPLAPVETAPPAAPPQAQR